MPTIPTTTPSSQTFGVDQGFVWLRNFDKGIFDTMGATYSSDTWYINDGARTVPVLFSNPDMLLEDFVVPSIVVRRDDVTQMMQRSERGTAGEVVTFRGIPAPTLGPDSCQNGNFDSPSNWIITGGWTIINDAMESTGGAVTQNDDGTAANFYQAGLIVSDGRYRVSFDIAGNTSGEFYLKTSKVNQRDYFVQGNGSRSIDIESAENETETNLYFVRSNDFDGSVDNISVQKITSGARTTVFKYNNGGTPAYSTGYDTYTTQSAATPFDIMYTISHYDRYRNTMNGTIRYLMNIFQPYHNISVEDSKDETRLYNGVMESTSVLDEVISATERTVGMALTIKVMGELDLNSTYVTEGGVTTDDPVMSTSSFNP